MKGKIKLVLQGIAGCFHEEAARLFFRNQPIEVVPASSFDQLAATLYKNANVDYGIMAIENSIAGSLLQNYRILRENHFWILGEVYLRIKHNLMALPGKKLEDIYEVMSHPMALNQCLAFLSGLPHIKLIETEDTALSAKEIKEKSLSGCAAIASEIAAEMYGLDILAPGIETSKVNYTRFFILQNRNGQKLPGNANKASVYLRVRHERGSLLKVLQHIYDHNINMSKLQSFPVLGKMSEYFFHIDLEFDHSSQYESLFEILRACTLEIEVLGIYTKASIYDHQTVKSIK